MRIVHIERRCFRRSWDADAHRCGPSADPHLVWTANGTAGCIEEVWTQTDCCGQRVWNDQAWWTSTDRSEPSREDL